MRKLLVVLCVLGFIGIKSLFADALGTQTSLTPYQEQQSNRFMQEGYIRGDRTYVRTKGSWNPTQREYNNFVCGYKPSGTVFLMVEDKILKSNCK